MSLDTEHLKQFRVLHTSNLDEARDSADRFFNMNNCRHKLDFARSPANLDIRYNYAPVGKRLSLGYFRYSGPVSVDAEISDYFLIQIPLAGDALVRNSGQEVFSRNHNFVNE
jgi:hypothetical protein